MLVLALWVGQVAAPVLALMCLGDYLGEHTEESCPDDDERGCHCPPNCGCCVTCSRGAPAMPPAMTALNPRLAVLVMFLSPRPDRDPPKAEPGEILHVPKRSLA
jgi:hypothetical protein